MTFNFLEDTMRMIIYLTAMMGLVLMSCSQQPNNPFFTEWRTPFGVPPFEQIKEEHFMPAFQQGMKEQQQEISAIAENSAEPNFDNTLVAMERSGQLLTKVGNVFFNFTSAITNDTLQAISKEIAPLLSKHNDDIMLNVKLFQRVQKIYEQKDQLNLNAEQYMLLDRYYKEFVRGGANLEEAQKARLRKINEELSLLAVKFGENVLKENNRFELVIDNEKDLAGLPEAVKQGAAQTAKERGKEGKWVFTLHVPSIVPFLQYAENRELREKIAKAYYNKCNNNDELDNKAILTKIAALRVERANLLGFPSHAAYVLDDNMAKTPENVTKLLNQLWSPALKRAQAELRDMQTIADRGGRNFKLEAWDWWYYAEKVKKEKYALDEEMLRPYFKLENVRDGAFAVANKLWGITFTKLNDVPKYHAEAEVFEVKEADGTHIGLLFTDYFPRASKRGGAWMNVFREQSALDGKFVTPIICNVGNFSKPVGDKPALLSFDEVNTLFHEFGHALHGLLSHRTYPKLTSTNVPRDFVELPSQIMENWTVEPEALKMFARHYQTGEAMPDELIEKIRKSALFNQGFATVEYLAASFLDMDWHTQTAAKEQDALQFEKAALEKINLMPEIVSRYRSTYFQHIFSGGYSSGYYSYVWAEVLDADAFQAFKETSLFDRKTAQAFRDNILSAGGSEDAMTLYKRFRGHEPGIEPLLERRGLK